MVLKLYNVYDRKVGIYHPPAFFHNKGHAIRHMTTLVNSEQGQQLNQYPGDFDLFEAGEFDDSTGIVKPYETLEFVLPLQELVKGNNEA